MSPLAIDLFCGLGGWTQGLLAVGYRVIGFDIESHCYPCVRNESGAIKRPGLNWSDRTKRGSKDAQFNRPPEIDPGSRYEEYPSQLVIQDVLTLRGSQFKDATLIVASPPCQKFSYMAMPWSKAKAMQLRIESSPRERKELTALFDACFRIQREACEAAGRHIPLIVENVRGAQKWVGRSRWNYGSFHLWGDVPALMPLVRKATKNTGGSWFAVANNTTSGHGNNARDRLAEGIKQSGMSGIRTNGKGDRWFQDGAARSGSKTSARKAASAAIAKIPFPLACYIASIFKPTNR